MICKVEQGMTFKGLVEYVTNELKGARIIASEGVCTVDVDAIIDSFAMQVQSGSTRIKKVVGHFALAWTSEERERLTDEFMGKLAREFMERAGYDNTQYVVSVHEDTDHPHCHVVYNRVDNDGRALNDSFLKRRSHKICRAMELKYGLARAEKSRLDRVNKEKLVGAAKAKFEMKKAVVNAAMTAKSWSEFRELLAAKGIRISFRYSRGGDIKGIIFSDGKQSYAGSKLHADCSLKKLDKQFGGELERSGFGKEIPKENLVPIILPFPQKESSPKTQTVPDFKVETDFSSDRPAVDNPSEDFVINGDKVFDFLMAATRAIGGSEMQAGGGGGSSPDSGWREDEKDREKNRRHQPKFAPAKTNVSRPKSRR